MKSKLSHLRFLALSCASFLAGCSPVYVLEAAYNQGKILLGRRPIEKVIEDADTSAEDREKLQLVIEAREFASHIGLTTNKSFTSYTDIGKETLAWIVVASRKDSFALHTWWFPIVGSVPYKGYFDERSAKAEAEALEREGYESCVRGTEAFSTLGWFNDPLLSTTLRNPPVRIANTVLHESVHSTVWIKNNVAFNESLANFVGSQATVEFFTKRREECRTLGGDCHRLDVLLGQAVAERAFQGEFGDLITSLYDRLERLYSAQDASSEEKIAKREGIFQEIMKPFRARYPALTALHTVNNAEIIQLKLYLTNMRLFEDVFAASGGSWGPFFDKIRGVRAAIDEDNSKDPFKALRDMVS